MAYQTIDHISALLFHRLYFSLISSEYFAHSFLSKCSIDFNPSPTLPSATLPLQTTPLSTFPFLLLSIKLENQPSVRFVCVYMMVRLMTASSSSPSSSAKVEISLSEPKHSSSSSSSSSCAGDLFSEFLKALEKVTNDLIFPIILSLFDL